MHNGYFITGTDTDAGKTVVAAALLSVMRSAGIDAVPMKPVQTGCIRCNDRLCSPDLDFCLRMSGLIPDARDEGLLCPYRFEPACSPHLAAAKAETSIDLEQVTAAAKTLCARHECVLVEGAGGVLVPMNDTLTMLDLMTDLGLPVIVASRPGLGTINHTLLTVHELRRAGLSVAGIIFSETKPGGRGEIERDNAVMVERLGNVPVLGCLSYMADLDQCSPAEFARRAAVNLNCKRAPLFKNRKLLFPTTERRQSGV